MVTSADGSWVPWRRTGSPFRPGPGPWTRRESGGRTNAAAVHGRQQRVWVVLKRSSGLRRRQSWHEVVPMQPCQPQLTSPLAATPRAIMTTVARSTSTERLSRRCMLLTCVPGPLSRASVRSVCIFCRPTLRWSGPARAPSRIVRAVPCICKRDLPPPWRPSSPSDVQCYTRPHFW
jgi:hypothetical protein